MYRLLHRVCSGNYVGWCLFPSNISIFLQSSMESGPTPALDPAPVETETRSSYPVVEFGTAIVALVNRALDAVPIRASTEEAVASEAAPPLTTEPLMSTAGSNVDVGCAHHSNALDDCLNSSEFDDMGKCHYYMDMVANCCRNSSS